MKIPAPPPVTCPHCYHKNPTFGPQRCSSCGMMMRSDQDQRVGEEFVKPRVNSLHHLLNQLAAHPQALALFKDIQPLLTELTPLSQRSDWLKEYLEEVDEFLIPFRQALNRFKRQLLVHLFVFFILLLAPILTFLLGVDSTISSLLFLPVIGWGYLGLWQYTKPLRLKPQELEFQSKSKEESSNNG